MSENEVVPEEFRCNRSDGKKWRCKKRALEGKKTCESHYYSKQNLNRNNKERSQRGGEEEEEEEEASSSKIDGVIRSKRSMNPKRKLVIGEAEAMDEAVRKMKLKRGDLQLDLIRMVLKREVEKKKKKKMLLLPNKKSCGLDDDYVGGGGGGGGGEELRKVLPNGIMAISPPSPTISNVTSPCDVKVGVESSVVSVTRRRFRSKNIEPLPVGKMQVGLFNPRKEKMKRKCHWCGTRAFKDLISCLSCEREFFCLVCVEKRNNGSIEEVEKKCPVCRGSCRCKVCLAAMSEVTECKDSKSGRSDIDRVLHLHYAVCMLLPVLKQINAEHKVKVKIEDTQMKGKNPTEPKISSSEITADNRQPCISRVLAVVDLPKRCTRSSSVYRLSSDNDRSQESLHRKVRLVKCSNGIKSCKPTPCDQSLEEAITDCKRKEVERCSNSLNLLLRSLFPLEFTSKLEISAEEIVSCYELPEILDKFLGCSFCTSNSDNHLKEASKRREDATGNFLYYPTVMDVQQNNLEHFQTHWSKGHPVIIRSVLKGGSSLNWDPLAMFCSYLMNMSSKTGDSTDDMDWFEVEIGVKQIFWGSLRGKAETDTCQEKLKLDGWLSSSLFKEHFPSHYAEVLRFLPIPRYMDPNRGLLNIAANLPDTIQTPNLGPCLNISYRSGKEDADSDLVKKLGFETCDTVDILLHVTETPVSTNQICWITKVMKSIRRARSKNSVKGSERGFCKGKKQERSRDLYAQRDWSDEFSSSDSESSQLSLGSEFQGEGRESCNESCEEEEGLSKSYGAHWDVFRKQDVSKLLEYIKSNSVELLELEPEDSIEKQVIHPLLEQSYYLDEYHKARLKEEFNVEPWSFDQCVGEAVVVPAGCPYQIRKNKSCVNAVLCFLSPEHVTESIERVDELNKLPPSAKSKAHKIEVKKMAVHKIAEAVEEIRKLTSSDSTATLRL